MKRRPNRTGGARDEEAEAERLGAEHAAREAGLGATGARGPAPLRGGTDRAGGRLA